ncbi:MAG: hypothetical protein FWH50_02725, partial [Coriobacteriia bacterium]|nr:hypothetical protein [Coriobacteriia bacterium]
EGNDDVDLRRPAWRMDYNHIIGYRHAMEQMRNFGFFRRDEHELHRFAEWVSNLHGVAKLSLSKPFLFSGPEISDVNFFAHATANEIGFPVVSIHIDIDERGNGAIRIFGPFRQRFFSGPPDLNELQTPCTVLLEDIGALQQIFQADQQAAMREQRNPQFAWEPGNRRSVQLEFGGYLRELINKPGVIFMATCEEGYVPDESLADITSAMRQIEVGYPTPDERRAIWERLKIDHASLQGIETEKLVGFSGNIARTAMFEATQVALDGAYQSSLSSGQYQPVQLTDILTSLSAYLDRDTEAYTRLEDAIVAEFMSDLDNSADL